jgi:hypothetical protein
MLAAGPVAAAERFDLICTVSEVDAHSPSGAPDTPFISHLGIDLTTDEWCIWHKDARRGCQHIAHFAKVTPWELRLDERSDPFLTLFTSIDRRTWRWTNYTNIAPRRPSNAKTEGQCVRKPFTPFPAAMRKNLESLYDISVFGPDAPPHRAPAKTSTGRRGQRASGPR